jgi:hypothetical protein
MGEAIADPHIASRGVLHHHGNGGNGVEGPFGVPLAAFKFVMTAHASMRRRRCSASTTRKSWIPRRSARSVVRV